MKMDVSIGELVDKVTILEIKSEKIKSKKKLVNIKNEYKLLKEDMVNIGITQHSAEFRELKKVNLKLWEIEDNIRIKEAKQEFDKGFIELARSVYFKNDDRATIKKEINIKYDSELVEEKEYIDYKNLSF